MIKIGPLLASEFQQAATLLKLQADVVSEAGEIQDTELILRSLAFWQHWLPCQLHMAPSMYVAREDNQVIGIISLRHISKSKTSWQVDKLVVHPDHRGRGIAQELLRYVFAQFGSQGVMHFLAEVPALNEAALTLFNHCGFCRSSRVTYYRFNPDKCKIDFARLRISTEFKLALPHLRSALYQLHSEVLPPALRQVLLLAPDDFPVRDPIAFTSVEKSKQKLMRTRVWYWVSQDSERMVLSSAVKVTAEPQSGYKLEMAVHPGWKEQDEDLLAFTLSRLLNDAPKAPIWAKVYDFQAELQQTMESMGFERSGEAFLLLREHWQRARKSKKASLPSLSNPVINFPLAADRTRLLERRAFLGDD